MLCCVYVYNSQEKKIDLKENLILDLEEKRRGIEMERSSLELSGSNTHFILSASLCYVMLCYVCVFNSQEKKIDLKENLILDLEEKRRGIEMERSSLELSGSNTHFLLSATLCYVMLCFCL